MISNQVAHYLAPDLGFMLSSGAELTTDGLVAPNIFPNTANLLADQEQGLAGLGLLEKLYNVLVGFNAYGQLVPRLTPNGFSGLLTQFNQLIHHLISQQPGASFTADDLATDANQGAKFSRDDIEFILSFTGLREDQQALFLKAWTITASYEALSHNRQQVFHIANHAKLGVRHSIAIEAGARRYIEQLDKITEAEKNRLVEHFCIPDESTWSMTAAGDFAGLPRINLRLLLPQHQLKGHPAQYLPSKNTGLTLIREILTNEDGSTFHISYGLQDTARRGSALLMREPQLLRIQPPPADATTTDQNPSQGSTSTEQARPTDEEQTGSAKPPQPITLNTNRVRQINDNAQPRRTQELSNFSLAQLPHSPEALNALKERARSLHNDKGEIEPWIVLVNEPASDQISLACQELHSDGDQELSHLPIEYTNEQGEPISFHQTVMFVKAPLSAQRCISAEHLIAAARQFENISGPSRSHFKDRLIFLSYAGIGRNAALATLLKVLEEIDNHQAASTLSDDDIINRMDSHIETMRREHSRLVIPNYEQYWEIASAIHQIIQRQQQALRQTNALHNAIPPVAPQNSRQSATLTSPPQSVHQCQLEQLSPPSLSLDQRCEQWFIENQNLFMADSPLAYPNAYELAYQRNDWRWAQNFAQTINWNGIDDIPALRRIAANYPLTHAFNQYIQRFREHIVSANYLQLQNFNF